MAPPRASCQSQRDAGADIPARARQTPASNQSSRCGGTSPQYCPPPRSGGEGPGSSGACRSSWCHQPGAPSPLEPGSLYPPLSQTIYWGGGCRALSPRSQRPLAAPLPGTAAIKLMSNRPVRGTNRRVSTFPIPCAGGSRGGAGRYHLPSGRVAIRHRLPVKTRREGAAAALPEAPGALGRGEPEKMFGNL